MAKKKKVTKKKPAPKPEANTSESAQEESLEQVKEVVVTPEAPALKYEAITVGKSGKRRNDRGQWCVYVDTIENGKVVDRKCLDEGTSKGVILSRAKIEVVRRFIITEQKIS